MNAPAIYLSSRTTPDPAICRGLEAAGYILEHTRSISEAIEAVKSANSSHEPFAMPILVAEVQSGALALLMIMREQAVDTPPTMVLDLVGDDIRVPVQAMQYDIEEYVLASDPDIQRESRARVLAERALMEMHEPAREIAGRAVAESAFGGNAPASAQAINWDPVAHVIHAGDAQLRLSPIQARIFDRLWTRRNTTVGMQELVTAVLLKPSIAVEDGVRLLRPHLVRLRSKLEQHPDLAHRIINVRGNGYMMI